MKQTGAQIIVKLLEMSFWKKILSIVICVIRNNGIYIAFFFRIKI